MIPDQKRGYNPDDKMRDLLRDNAMLLPALSRFDIAFGFGDSTVKDVCLRNGVDIDTFICVCNLLSGYKYDRNSISLSTLMDYLKRAHTSFLDVEFPKIRHYLIDAINYKETNEVALLLMKFFDDYVKEVRKHMEYENDVIFEYVDQLLSGNVDEDFNITRYSESHSDTVAKLNELKDIFISHYNQKDNMRLSGALLDIIICGRDMLSHFDVENQLLIPVAKKLERQLKSKLVAASVPEPDKEDNYDQLDLLSEREKEIIRKVALGLSNKEIADELYISVHTVATHRRNISSKLEIHTTAGLIIFAIINHLVDITEVRPA